MRNVRGASLDDADLVAGIGTAGFYDDPVLSWVFDDPGARMRQLHMAFVGLARDTIPDRGATPCWDRLPPLSRR